MSQQVFWDDKPNIAHWSEWKIPQAAFLLLCFPVSCQERSRSLNLGIGLGIRRASVWDGTQETSQSWQLEVAQIQDEERFYIGEDRKLSLGSCEVCSAQPLSP